MEVFDIRMCENVQSSIAVIRLLLLLLSLLLSVHTSPENILEHFGESMWKSVE